MNSLGAMNIEFGLSKKWLTVNLLLTFVFYGCLVVTLVGPTDWAGWMAIVAFVVQLGIVLARVQSNGHYALGESVRRPAMLQNGLGTRPTHLQLAKISAKYGIAFSGDPITPEKYYESRAEAGPRRLLEITEESAFWTSELAERMANLLRITLGGVVVLVMLAAFAVLQSRLAASRAELVGRIAMGTITLWCTGELFALYKKYDALARGVQRVLAGCEAIQEHPEVDSAAAVTFGEYNCCLASGAVIPDFVYRWNREKLNSAWALRNDGARGNSETC